MRNSECYLCKNKKLKQKKGSVRDNADLKIFECLGCGLTFLSSFKHIAEDFYKDSNMHSQEEDLESWIKETEPDDQRRFQYCKSFLANCSLLDFGCGTGNFLLKAKSLVKKAEGVEPEVRLQEHFKKNSLKVHKDVLDIPENSRYDLITLFHTLEHLIDPREVLAGLSKLLSKNGQIIIEVPNADDALLTFYQCEEFSHFTYWSCHLFLFTRKTLEMLAKQADLKINFIDQVQRYPLSNHLFWLAKGKPGGHKEWSELNSSELHLAYEKQLASIGYCDTLIASFQKK